MLYRSIEVLHDDVNSRFHSKWINEIKSISDSCRFRNILSQQGHLNTSWIKLALDLGIKDIDKQNWHSVIF